MVMYEENIEILEEKEPKKENRFFKKDKKEKIKKEKKIKEKKEPKEKKNKENGKKLISFKADWVAISVKLGLFLFISFVLIFIFTKINSSQNSFTNHLEKMKDVSYVYFKVPNNRPSMINEEVTMTLGDMEEGSLLPELKIKKEICSKEFSYVSLNKKNDINYDLTVYLSCGGEAKKAVYEVTYQNSSNNNTEETILYELKREVVSEKKYTCPSGYTLNGKYCDKTNEVSIIDATPNYKITPEKNVPAKLKPSNSNYEYIDPIITNKEETLECPKGYTLREGKCEIKGTVKYKTSIVYTCQTGTQSGTKCLLTTEPEYSNTELYCSKGIKLNGQCYVTTKYSVRCIHGIKDSSRNACYKTYSTYKELSDWLYDGIVTYSEKTKLKDTDTVYYDPIQYHENGKITYKKYIRKYIKKCDEGDIRDGNLCKHYDESYEERYCSDSKYTLNKDKTECYYYESMQTKKVKETYKCPTGYTKKGSGENVTCVRYEKAVKKVEKTPYCSSQYDLTSDNLCIKRIDATESSNSKTYECPDGYTKRGENERTVCYKKVTSESYYYCSNSSAILNKDRCIIPSKMTFLNYSCPKGYSKSSNKCIKKD